MLARCHSFVTSRRVHRGLRMGFCSTVKEATSLMQRPSSVVAWPPGRVSASKRVAPATLHSAEASFEALGIRHDMLAFTPADGGGSAPHLHGEAVLHAWPHLLRWSRGLLVRTHRARVQQVASERLQDAWRKALTEARATSAPSVQRRPRSAVAQGGVKRAQPLLMAAGSQSPRYRRYSTPSSSRDGGVE